MIKLPFCLIIFYIFLFLPAVPVKVFAASIAKVTIRVVDEGGNAIEDAEIGVGFKGGYLRKEALRGKSNADGIFSVFSSSEDGQIGGAVTKNGYYTSVFHNSFVIKKWGRWQPWNKEITVMMRPIINPVPMYVRDKWIEIPEVGKEIGFDLTKFEWVTPYGQGTHADFIFKVDRKYVKVFEFDTKLTLTFSNPHDGIHVIKDDLGGIYNEGSWFRFPRTAPEGGFKPSLTKRFSQGSFGWHDDHAKDNNYIFRVRSEVDEEGKLKSAIYGKIRGDISFDPRGSKTAKIHFLYYLNPDGTRNLEYDPSRNLFSPLPSGETSIGLP